MVAFGERKKRNLKGNEGEITQRSRRPTIHNQSRTRVSPSEDIHRLTSRVPSTESNIRRYVVTKGSGT